MKTYPGRSTYTGTINIHIHIYSIGAHKRVRSFIFMHTAIKIYKGLIEPHFDYCSVVWDGLSRQLNEKVQKLQNRAARVITKSSYDTNSSYLLNSLSWNNLSVTRTNQKANLMYKCVNKLAPVYFCNMFSPRTFSFELRDARQNCVYRNQELIPWSAASVTVELLYETIFQRYLALQNLKTSTREALINGSLHRTPTRQVCKPVNRKFYMWCFFFSIIVMLIFLPFIHSFIHSFIQSFSHSVIQSLWP